MADNMHLGGKLRDVDDLFDELDGFWLMWEKDDCVAKLTASPTLLHQTTTDDRRYVKYNSFLPPIDIRPLVARNQFVSQGWLDDIMGIVQHKGFLPCFPFPNHSYGNGSSHPFIESTIRAVSSAIHGNKAAIDEILPEPGEGDYIDLLQERRPSYQTTLKLFALGNDTKDADKENGYSSRHFWRSFLGSQYSCINVDFNQLQK